MIKQKEILHLEAPSEGPYLCGDIYHGQLPPQLERAVTVATEPEKQDILLLSALTAYSYALPNMRMLHGDPQETYYPNLMTVIVAPPASGKGVMNNARLLIKPIDQKLREENRDKNKKRLAIIPVNSSIAAFFKLINDNDGKGFMMATEIDTLSKNWKADYCNLSDLLRAAYSHEPYSKARKADAELFEVESPQLSVLLSGTPNQVEPLFGTGEDGLASRFLPYFMTDIRPFDYRVMLHGDHYRENGVQTTYTQLGKELLERYQWLSSQDHFCLWCLDDNYAELFGKHIRDLEDLANLEFSKAPNGKGAAYIASFNPLFKRMVVNVKRIGMILSTLRLDMTKPLPEVLYCDDQDYRTLYLLAYKFTEHLKTLVYMLPEQKSPLDINILDQPSNPKTQQLLDLLPDKFTTAEALKIGGEMNLSIATTERHLAFLKEEKCIIRVEKGHYCKVK